MNRIARILEKVVWAVHARSRRTTVGVAAAALAAATSVSWGAGQNAPAHTNEMLELLQQYAAVSDVDDPMLREMYEELVFEGSEAHSKMAAHLSAMEARINSAVERGDLSRVDADAKLEAVSREIDARVGEMFLVEVFQFTRSEARLAMTRERLDEAVEAGEITREEADAKLAAVTRGTDLEKAWTAAIERKRAAIRALVESGDISAEEGRTRMAAFERGLKVRLEHQAAVEKFDALVKSGEMTREEADERLARFRAGLKSRNSQSDVDWDSITRRVEGAVERGDLSRAEADQVYKDIKRRAAGDGAAKAGESKDERNAQFKRRIAGALADAGVPRDQLRTGVAAVEKIAAEIRQEGDEFELNPRISAWLEREEFTAEQVQSVLRLARRVAHAKTER